MAMNRREALQNIAWLMGGTVSASAILAMEKGFAASATTAVGSTSVLLKPQEMAIVSAVAETMIPRTDTPGARDVGVPGFIDLMLKEVYLQEDRERYFTGLAEFDTAAQRGSGGRHFADLNPTQQLALVRTFHDAAVAEELRVPHPRGELKRPFILMTKEMTLLGFFTSESGATQVLQYAAIPGSYHGCIPLQQAGNGRTWAVAPGLTL
jgi:gluconate 2-dehydrogenase gamma chain